MLKERVFLIALFAGIGINTLLMFFTLTNTYDALIHVFFGSHYAQSWFDPWEPRWYTGFSVMSYPPLVHELIGLLSYIGGLKFGMYVIGIVDITLFITAIFRFTFLLFNNSKIAAYAALFAAFSTVFLETLHIFGQLPTLMGISLLLHSLPYISWYFIHNKTSDLAKGLSFLAMTVSSHHVTTIFGMVFFIAPLIGYSLLQKIVIEKQKINPSTTYSDIRLKEYIQTVINSISNLIYFGIGAIFILIFCILPYWIFSKKDPISQVPIPHGSRDSFLEVTSSGLMFFLIPWGLVLVLFPYIFYRLYSKKFLFFGLSYTLLVILGTGGTTPIPKMILGSNAFNILTLERFTFWASIMSIPFVGEFIYNWQFGNLYLKAKEFLKGKSYRILSFTLIILQLFSAVFVISMGFFRPFQPPAINMKPILNFINLDQHYKWRHLTLGFGDQMSWLSAQTNSQSVDGNYHSARRLPELTTRAVERLENSKFLGFEGLGSLQQMLTNSNKYNLKFIFSNDKFYDPLLYFYGWYKLNTLENGIAVWERSNVKQLPAKQNRKYINPYLRYHWGLMPITTIGIALLFLIFTKRRINQTLIDYPSTHNAKNQKYLIQLIFIWMIFLLGCFSYGFYKFYIKNTENYTPENIIRAYYNAIDFKEFEHAYKCLLPNSKSNFDQFLLEISLQDGILNSYGKMDSIGTKIIKQDKNKCLIHVTTKWITPLKSYIIEEDWETKKIKNKWFIVKKSLDPYVQKELMLGSVSTKTFNVGRRKMNPNQTQFNDELPQPTVHVVQANLVEENGFYSVVGEMINFDDITAAIDAKVELYSANNELVAEYNAEDIIKHFLLPKGATSFKIDFRPIAWLNQDMKPNTFDPEQKELLTINPKPTHFVLHISTNFSVIDIYNQTSIKNFNPIDFSGYIYNSGVQEITIPQLLCSYYNKDEQLIWVDANYINGAIKPQKRRYFSLPEKDISEIKIVYNGLKDVYINGLPNELFNYEKINYTSIPKINSNNIFYKLELNNFIGNPK